MGVAESCRSSALPSRSFHSVLSFTPPAMLVVYNGTYSQLHVAVSSADWSSVVDPMDYCKPDLNCTAPETLRPLSTRSKRQSRRRRTQLTFGERDQYTVDLPRKPRNGYRELSTRGDCEWPWRVYVVHVRASVSQATPAQNGLLLHPNWLGR